jgi:diguanylate cyclase (GGDEF)-like protein
MNKPSELSAGETPGPLVDQTAVLQAQTRADDDQRSSVSDQVLADRDQAASESDQRSRDDDQDASDDDLAAGGDAVKHRRSRLARERTTRSRTETSASRDERSAARLQTAAERDHTAELRDGGAADRDRERAAVDRAQAAADRVQAAAERIEAARDRAEAMQLRSDAEASLKGATTDVLTGARTRQFGLAEVSRELSRAQRTGAALTLAFVDVDGLKQVNDTEGHAAGDALLKRTGHTLRAGLRDYDLVVRYGGDEFICVMPNLVAANAMLRFATIAAELAAIDSEHSITFGLAEAQPLDVMEELVARADRDLLGQRSARNS